MDIEGLKLDFSRRVLLAVALLFACGLSAVVASPADAGEQSAYRRWAVLADGSAQEIGLADLVMTQLAKEEGLQLVERDQLETLTRELKLSELVDSQAAEKRLRLGQMLKADALVLLSCEGREPAESVKLVIAESRHGVRLRVEFLPFATGKQEELASRIATAVAETRRHFAGGIHKIIGVSPFVSKNLTHDYDHLQASYAYLLENALMVIPNVAVIETEEAVSVGRELALSGESSVRRIVPVLLEVDFLVEPAGGDEEPEITFTVRTQSTRDHKKPRVETEQMPLGRAPWFITRQLPHRLTLTGSQGGFSSEEQVRWLVDRAEVFSQLGDWQHATALREAALLLDPNQTRQRLKLVFEYRKIFFKRTLDHEVRDQYRRQENPPLVDDPIHLQSFQARAAAYLAALPHLEHLVRNRRLDRALALELGVRLLTQYFTIGLPLESLSDQLRWRVMQRLDTLERAETVMLAEVFPLMLSLPETLPEDLASEKWHETNYHLMNFANYSMRLAHAVIDGAAYRSDRKYFTNQDLADIRRAMQLVAKLKLTISSTRPGLYDRSPLRHSRDAPAPDEISVGQWVAFLHELKNQPSAAAKMHGFQGLLEALRRDAGKEYVDGRVVVEEALVWLDRYDNDELPEWEAQFLAGPARFLRRQCERYVLAEAGGKDRKPALPATTRPIRESPVMSARVESTPSGDQRVLIGRLRLEEVGLKVQHLDGRTAPLGEELKGLTACGDGLDVAWSEHAVFLMRKPGLLSEVLVDADEKILAAAWDGRSVWVARLQKDVVVLNPAGRLIGRIGTRQGLPPHDKKLLIHTIEPDRCFAVGQFGKLGRAWCALIQREKTGPGYEVRVFHEATKAPLKNWHNTPDDPQLVFEPMRLHVCDTPLDDRRVLYVFRRAEAETAHGYPLVIDLATLEVHIVKEPFHDMIDVGSHWLPGFHTPHGEEMDRARWAQRPALCRGGAAWPPWPFYRDGWHYAINGPWKRMNAKTYQIESLLDGLFPQEYQLTHRAVSGHYGFVGWGAWHRGKVYRITVGEGEKPINADSPNGPQ